MTEKHLYPVSPEVAKQALLNREQYEEMYRRSVEDPEGFWAEAAADIAEPQHTLDGFLHNTSAVCTGCAARKVPLSMDRNFLKINASMGDLLDDEDS